MTDERSTTEATTTLAGTTTLAETPDAGSPRSGGDLLVVVDVQRDFCEGGALAVDGGNEVARRIRAHVQRNEGRYAAIAVSQDWHRADTDNGGHFAAEPDFRDTWPAHCVAGTEGAELHPAIQEAVAELELAASQAPGAPRLIRVRKGYGTPAYNALEGSAVDVGSDGGEQGVGAPFVQVLRDGGWERADVVGLALDHCVDATARGLHAMGLPTRILRDLSAAVDPAGAEEVCARLTDAGIEITDAGGQGS